MAALSRTDCDRKLDGRAVVVREAAPCISVDQHPQKILSTHWPRFGYAFPLDRSTEIIS